MTAVEQILDALRAAGHTVVENGQGQAKAQCPAHNDTQPSLSVGERADGKGALLHCHAGCDYTAVLAALKLTPSDLFDDKRLWNAYRTTATYVYPGGRQVHRKPDKSFPQGGVKTDRNLYHADRI